MLDANATAGAMLGATSVDSTEGLKQKVRMCAGTGPGNTDGSIPSPRTCPDGEKWGSPRAPSLPNL